MNDLHDQYDVENVIKCTDVKTLKEMPYITHVSV